MGELSGMRFNAVKRLICTALAALLMMCGIVTAFAQTEDIDALIESAVAHQLELSQTESVQQWIDSGLSDSAGRGAEWYVIALSRLGGYDFSRYAASLAEYIGENGPGGALARQKCALALQCAGYTGEYIAQTPAETTGRQGIMSIIFGLHVLNNMQDAKLSGQTIASLLELQLADGGWALYGDVSDVDVTAMAVQALALHRNSRTDAAQAIEAATALLSERQQDNGGYSGFGKENAESCAQVIMALSALGIDCRTDERFVKNGRSPLDALLDFRLGSGGFEHEHGGGENSSASVQALCALISIKTGAVYAADAQEREIDIHEPTEDAPENTKKTPGYKFWVMTGTACACVLLCAAAVIKNAVSREKNTRKTLKNCIAIAAAGAVIAAITAVTDIKSAGEFYSGESVAESAGKVSFSISCESVAGLDGLPEDGVILEEQSFDIAEGETVYDLLVRAAKQYRIQTDASGTGELVYVSGIANLYEFDHGDLSGWVYTVNGAVPSVGCGAYRLADGDRVAWIYTTDMGRELE